MHRLTLDVSLPRLELDIRLPALRLEQRPPRLEVDIESPSVVIDLSEPMAEIGLKDPWRFARSVKEQSQQDALEAIGSLAREGDVLAAVEKGTTVADAAAMRSNPPVPELNVTALPRTRPKIIARGSIAIRWELGDVWGELFAGAVEVHVIPGAVQAAVEALPRPLGRRVDIWA